MLAAILACLVSCNPNPVSIAGAVPPVEAVFIDPWDEMEKHSQAEWDAVLQSARAVGVRAVIIKKLITINKDGAVIRDFTAWPLTERIIAAAGSDIDVYVGLATQEEVSTGSFEILKRESERAAKHVSKMQFKGWYVSVEAWNFAKGSPQIVAFHDFYRDVVKGLPARDEVVASPYVNPSGLAWLSNSADAPEVFEQVFAQTGVTMLLIQDGAGGREDYEGDAAKWPIDIYLAAVQPYLSGISARLQKKMITVWVNVEAFEGDDSAAPKRFHKQLRNVPGGLRVAAFDFYHHLNPVTADMPGDNPESPLRCRKRLYSSYRAWEKRPRR